MGLKRVSWVRRYQGQCRALRPLGHQGYRLRSYKKDPPLCSGYTDPVKAFFVALFVCLEALCVLPIRSASCFHRRFVVPFVQKKVSKSSTSCCSPHPL